MTDGGIVVHQALHGYRDGHQLLQSSLALSADDQRTLLIQSDLSGPVVLPGFEEYVSGYPLERSGFYVLARTWYAREMERPGCVWTHSLLIGFPELAETVDLGALTNLFSRPSRDTYGREPMMPLLLPTNMNAPVPDRASNASIDEAQSILVSLYECPDQPVLVFESDASRLEPILLAIWSQQWPRLRRTFRFCSGALSYRTEGGVLFDLLVMPPSLRSSVQREAPKASLVPSAVPGAVPSWLGTALDDLRSPNVEMRTFLRTFGSEEADPRGAWRHLLEAYTMLGGFSRGHLEAADLVVWLETTFPTARDGRRIKMAALGPSDERADTAEAAILKNLGTSARSDAFDIPELAVGDRALRLWQHARETALVLVGWLLGGPVLTKSGEVILASLLDQLDVGAAEELERGNPGIRIVLVRRNPSLARTPSFWQTSIDVQREMCDVLAHQGHGALEAAVGAMVVGASSVLALDASRALGKGAAAAVLRAVDENRELLLSLPGSWGEILAREPESVIAWLQTALPPSIERLVFALQYLRPWDDQVRRISAGEVIAAGGRKVGDLHGETRVVVAAFMLGRALSILAPDGAEVVALSFGYVYNAASADNMSYDAWRWLSDILPPASWWRPWDRCERLSLGLIAAFARAGWPLAAFFEATRSIEALEQAMSVARSFPEGAQMLSRILAECYRQDLGITRDQRRLLDRL